MNQPTDPDSDLRTRAEQMWREDGALVLGQLLTEGREPEAIVAWARDLLDLAARWVKPPASVREVQAVVADPRRWHEGKRAFEAVRQDTLAFERSGDRDAPLDALLVLAENTAKVAYNATMPTGPFDAETDDLDRAERQVPGRPFGPRLRAIRPRPGVPALEYQAK